MRRLRRFLTGTSGAAAVEFAIVSPLLVILLSWMVSIGLQALAQGRLNEAVRETAEAALFTQDTTVLQGVLVTALSDAGVTGSTRSITRFPADQTKPLEYLTISVQIPFTPLFGARFGPSELTSQLEVQIR